MRLKIKNRALLTFLIFHSSFLIPFVAMAQQDGIFSQYMFNQLSINPAYAGTKANTVDASLFHRNQWTSLKGAPVTESLNIHAPIGYAENIGLGVQVFNEKIGSLNNFAVLISTAYKIKIKEGKLSLGLKTGIFNYSIRRDRLDYLDPNDVQSLYNFNSKTVAGFDFGAYYYIKNFYAGITANHINQPDFYIRNGFNNYGNEIVRHYFITSGYALKLNENITFKPSTLIKYVKNAPLNVDLNATVCFYNVFSPGFSYRTNRGLVFLVEYYFTKALRAGYAFDWMVNNKVSSFRPPTHEIYLGYSLKLHKKKTITNSPRF